MKLHYKDEKAFSFEKYFTKFKELFRVLDKDPHKKYSGPRQVEFMLHGITSSDVGIISAKTNVFATPHMKSDFDQAVNFMSAYVSSRHFEAQSKYANRNNGQRRNISATGSDGDRGGRGRGGRSGQRGGPAAGRGRGGRGRGSGRGRMRSYINEVDVTDPNRNFTAAEWERLGTMRGVVLRMREGNTGAGRGGRGGNDSRSQTSNTNRTTNGVSATDNSNNNNETAEASVVSEITERGSQNGRGFGRGAYNAHN